MKLLSAFLLGLLAGAISVFLLAGRYSVAVSSSKRGGTEDILPAFLVYDRFTGASSLIAGDRAGSQVDLVPVTFRPHPLEGIPVDAAALEQSERFMTTNKLNLIPSNP